MRRAALSLSFNEIPPEADVDLVLSFPPQLATSFFLLLYGLLAALYCFQDSCVGEDVDDLVPPSLKTLCVDFNPLVECGGAIRKEKLLLRAVTLQGLPVEDMPRVDIWDDGGLIVSSHDNKREEVDEKDDKRSTIWADDDAFYRVNNNNNNNNNTQRLLIRRY